MNIERTTRTCSKCKLEKCNLEFYTKKDRVSGYDSWCKSCAKVSKLNKTEAQKKRDTETRKRHNRSNYEECMLKRIRFRAKYRDIPFNLDLSDIVIPEFCPILGVKLQKNITREDSGNAPSVDRIDNDQGYIKGNIMIISTKANLMKNNASKEELLAFSEYFIKQLT